MAEKKLEWTVKDITDPTTGYTVRISRNNMIPPRYSVREGNKPIDGTADDRIRPFNSVVVNWKTVPPTVVSKKELRERLYAQAEQWIREDAAAFAATRKAR